MWKNILLIPVLTLLLSARVSGQNSRINTNENIGWYNGFVTVKASDKLGIHTEYQWRRVQFIEQWQQSLLRVGLNYHLNPRVMFRIGYAWIETFPYGEIPVNGLGRDFTEHRIYEMAQLSHKEGKLDLWHRFMLEQRFVGRYSDAAATTEDEFPLLNRARYMIRLQMPLNGSEIKEKTPYLAVYDEIFIGWGPNVNNNIFDQNRLGVLLGYQFTKDFRMEGGYLAQTVLLGRQIGGRNVIQNNNGFIVNAQFNIDLTKNKPAVDLRK